MWAPVRRTAPSSPLPVAANPSPRNMSWSTCTPSANRAGPESLRSSAPVQSRSPPMWAPVRRTAPASAWPMTLALPRPSTLQVRRSPSRGGSAGCSSWHPVRTTEARRASRARTPSSRRQSFSSRLTSVVRFSRSSRPVILAPRSRSPCGSGSAASRPRKMSRITVARQVRELTPRPHRGLINRLIIGGQVEPFPAADVLDQRLLHRG